MKIDLHNHTTLCNHANGTVEEYIQQAIIQNIHIYGFSDHAPMAYDEKYRMDFAQMMLYERWVKEVKEKYADKIEVLLAYEVDYMEGYIDARVLERDVDYLIGSVHFIDKWGFDNPAFIGGYEDKDIDLIWEEYFRAVEAMANTGYFQIVGHMDLLKVFKFLPKGEMKALASDALDAIKKAGMAVEINTAGWRKPVKEQYPSRTLLQEIHKRGIPITFGSDAHEIAQVGQGLDEAYTLAREIGFTQYALFRNKKMEMINL